MIPDHDFWGQFKDLPWSVFGRILLRRACLVPAGRIELPYFGYQPNVLPLSYTGIIGEGARNRTPVRRFGICYSTTEIHQHKLAKVRGIEPPTLGFGDRRSTTELHQHELVIPFGIEPTSLSNLETVRFIKPVFYR